MSHSINDNVGLDDDRSGVNRNYGIYFLSLITTLSTVGGGGGGGGGSEGGGSKVSSSSTVTKKSEGLASISHTARKHLIKTICSRFA